jgi:hypothetical protein
MGAAVDRSSGEDAVMAGPSDAQAVVQLFLEYLVTILVGWAGIVLLIISLVGLVERALGRPQFTLSTRNKTILAIVVLFIAQFGAYKREHDEATLRRKERAIQTMRSGLLPFIDEGQRMWPECLTVPLATIDDWAGRVEGFLRSKGDEVRIRKFRDESGIRPNLPPAAIKGYTAEQAHKCIRLDARLNRLNGFLTRSEE